jgi:phosphoglucomutase
VRRLPYERARKAPSVHRHDYIGSYVADLMNVVDMEAIRPTVTQCRRERPSQQAAGAHAVLNGRVLW